MKNADEGRATAGEHWQDSHWQGEYWHDGRRRRRQRRCLPRRAGERPGPLTRRHDHPRNDNAKDQP